MQRQVRRFTKWQHAWSARAGRRVGLVSAVSLQRSPHSYARGEVEGLEIPWLEPGMVELRGARAVDVPLVLTARVGSGRDFSCLSPEETSRMDSIRLADRAHVYGAAHVLLRQVLAWVTGFETSAIEYRRRPCPACGGPHGRPVLAQAPDWHFSLAHSRDAVALAVGRHPIGVDIEFEAPKTLCSYVTHMLNPVERRLIQEAAESARGGLLAAAWTRKEALLKGRGSGFCGWLGTDDMTEDIGGWSLCALPAPKGYFASLALPPDVSVGQVSSCTPRDS